MRILTNEKCSGTWGSISNTVHSGSELAMLQCPHDWSLGIHGGIICAARAPRATFVARTPGPA